MNFYGQCHGYISTIKKRINYLIENVKVFTIKFLKAPELFEHIIFIKNCSTVFFLYYNYTQSYSKNIYRKKNFIIYGFETKINLVFCCCCESELWLLSNVTLQHTNELIKIWNSDSHEFELWHFLTIKWKKHNFDIGII